MILFLKVFNKFTRSCIYQHETLFVIIFVNGKLDFYNSIQFLQFFFQFFLVYLGSFLLSSRSLGHIISGKNKLTLSEARKLLVWTERWLSSALCYYRFICNLQRYAWTGGRGGRGHLKVRGVIIGPKRYQDSCFMGMVQIHFLPFEVSTL